MVPEPRLHNHCVLLPPKGACSFSKDYLLVSSYPLYRQDFAKSYLLLSPLSWLFLCLLRVCCRKAWTDLDSYPFPTCVALDEFSPCDPQFPHLEVRGHYPPPRSLSRLMKVEDKEKALTGAQRETFPRHPAPFSIPLGSS